MKIGNAGNMNTTMQAGMSRGTDGTAKNIQSQIANTQKQLQQLSENNEMSVEEKIKKRQEINQQMIELNNQLRQHQIKQQREKQEDKKSSGDDMLGGKNKMNKRTSNGKSGGLSQASMKAMISADSAVSQAEVQGSVASKMDGRAGVLKAEIKQDAGRGAVGGKKEELAEVEQKAMVATNAQMKNSIKRLIRVCLCIIIVVVFIKPLPKVVAGTTKSIKNKGGELHAFYPSYAKFSKQMKKYIDDLDSISFAWSMIDPGDYENLNTVKGRNNNYSFYYPSDFIKPLEYAQSKGKQIQLSVYMDGKECSVMLSNSDKRSAAIKAIINSMKIDTANGESIQYDGVVIDFEGLRDKDNNNKAILYNGKPISTYYTQFLYELRIQLNSIDKNLYVAVNPLLYYDGYDYEKILDIVDRMIIMAHDYEPIKKLNKNQVQQYMGYDALDPISSLAPIQMVRQALNDIQNAASNASQLSKVWLQISFDTAQWQFDVKSEKDWKKLAGTTLSRTGRLTPLYESIKARVYNVDGHGKSISYGYNNELQSPYIQYYNSLDKSFNVIIYEDSTSISAKISLAKAYNLGGISLWGLSNIPDDNTLLGKKFHLDGWKTVISEMKSYGVLPSENSKYVKFSDNAIEKAVRLKLGKPSGKITISEVKSIYRLKLSKGVKSLKDIKKLSNLEYLDASGLGLKNIVEIGELKKLRILYLQRNSISNITAIKKLNKLEILSLNGNRVTSISSLSSLKNLKELYIRENKIKNIKPLNKLKKIEKLYY